MSASGHAPRVYNIPAGIPFAAALAGGLLDKSRAEDIPLTRFRILMPTRRACRNLRETFLRLTDGKPLLLPHMQPIGDVDEDELVLELAGKETAAPLLEMPPSLPPLRRQILLARTIMTLPDFTRGPDQAFALAGTLGRLMDQIYTEGLDLKDLPSLVEDESLARHWQITVRFLEILSEIWPKVLAENDVIDTADRRNRLIAALAAHWQDRPPSGPVIAAGSTGSIPVTGHLLKVIATLPQGAVILPGLDPAMDEKSWQSLDDSHPQALLKLLLTRIGSERTDVQPWPYSLPTDRREEEPPGLAERKRQSRCWLASEMMRPSSTADHWQNLNQDAEQKHFLTETLKQVKRFECHTSQDEAKLIAILMREALETPQKTAALITPDRTLARRVAMICRRWNIKIDDSGGQPLSQTALGSYLRLIVQTATNLKPGLLAALLKHKYCLLGRDRQTLTNLANRLEVDILRGTLPGTGFKALNEKAEDKQADTALLRELEGRLAPLMGLTANTGKFSAILDVHLQLAEELALNGKGHHKLWQGEAGEAAALFLADLRDQAAGLPDVNGETYLAILEQLMRTVNVRPSYGTHPRLFILGQLEARLIQADLVILGGLNEGTWPPDPGNDPWMSRPMRQRFRLPSPERSIGLAAHDFVQGFCAPHVVLTRARRVGGAPSVPARWLQRLDTVLQALEVNPEDFSHGQYMQWADGLDKPQNAPAPVGRPRPCPPVDRRPDELYVTAIERWMRDPYSLYARYILNLRRLEDLEEKADAAERGTMMHDVLDHFVSRYPDGLPPDPYGTLITLGRQELADRLEEPRLWGFWWPRFERLAHWFVIHEQQWRQWATPQRTEARGTVTLDIDDRPFTLSAKADRIDLMPDGYAVIDYKTGGAPSAAEVNNGYAPQLPLEGLILSEGGFAGLTPEDIAYLGFWSLSGGATPGEEKPVKADIEQARAGLIRLVRAFRNPETPYFSLPRPDKAPPAAWQDYAHLARVQEWAALDDNAGEAA